MKTWCGRAWATAAGLAVVAVALTLAHRPAPAAAAPTPAPKPTSPQPTPDPRALYLRDCAVCHGADATGTGRGPTLIGVGRASIDYYVSTGRMPLVDHPARDPVTRRLQPLPADQLGDPEAVPRRRTPAYPPDAIRRLVDYVAAITGPGVGIPAVDPGAGDVARGGEIFRLQCAACHAWAGDGGALLHREAPSLHQATPTQIGEAVRAGPGLMPAFGAAAIPAGELDSLVAYVRYLDHPEDRGGHPVWHLGPVAEGGVAWAVGMVLLLLLVRWIGERG